MPLEISTDHATKALRERIETVLHYHGPFRVYFYRKENVPRVVSIANGSHTWEIHCKTAKLSVALKSEFRLHTVDRDLSFWLEGVGQITVDAAGNAVIQ